MKVDKPALFARIRAALEAELAAIHAAAEDARSAATHEDARPENQYDTRGLEASYLAGAQASRAEDLARRIRALGFLEIAAFGPDDPIALTAAFALDDGDRVRRYLLSPEGGGLELASEAGPILVITPRAPVGAAVLERRLHDVVEVPRRGQRIDMEIVELA